MRALRLARLCQVTAALTLVTLLPGCSQEQPPTECNMVAQTQARKLAAKPLSALIETKRLMKQGQTAAVLERMAEEGASFGRMLQEPAAREAFSAFVEKRRPDFSAV